MLDHCETLQKDARENQARRLARAAALAAAIEIVAVTIAIPPHPERMADAGMYRALARTAPYPADVAGPFSWRILEPSLVRMLSGWFGADGSFLVVALLSMLLMGASLYLLNLKAIRYPLIITATFLLPFEIQSLPTYYLPDLLHAALLALFLLATSSEADVVASAILLLLVLTRESTILLSLIVIVLAWRMRRAGLGAGAALASLIGIGITHHFASLGASNIEGFPGPLYFTLKLAYNAVHNFTGISLVISGVHTEGCQAEWLYTLPQILQSKYISQIGLCRWQPGQIAGTLLAWLTSFGALPAVAICCVAKNQSELSRAPAWVLIAFLYGAIAFVIAPITGTWVDRLTGYGWPLFLVATPYLFERLWSWEPGAAVGLAVLHAGLIGINLLSPLVFGALATDERVLVQALVVVGAAAIQFAAYRMLSRAPSSEPESAQVSRA